MDPRIALIERKFLRNDVPEFRPGDNVKVHVKVKEGNRERIQVFEGIVIARQKGGLRENFIVRKMSGGWEGEDIPALPFDRRQKSSGRGSSGGKLSICASQRKAARIKEAANRVSRC